MFWDEWLAVGLFYPFGYDRGVVFMFQDMDAVGQGLSGFTRVDINGGLENCFAMVILFIHQMDGDPALFVSCIQYSLVYMFAIHPFAAMFRQQCRVDVEDAVGEAGN